MRFVYFVNLISDSGIRYIIHQKQFALYKLKGKKQLLKKKKNNQVSAAMYLDRRETVELKWPGRDSWNFFLALAKISVKDG